MKWNPSDLEMFIERCADYVFDDARCSRMHLSMSIVHSTNVSLLRGAVAQFPRGLLSDSR